MVQSQSSSCGSSPTKLLEDLANLRSQFVGGVGAKRRLQNPIHGAPTSASETMVFQTTKSAREKGSSGEGAGGLGAKACHRASTTKHTSLLQPHLSCSQGRGGGGGKMEANHRSVELKRLHRGSKVKDGNHGGNPGFHSIGRLVHIPGSRGCVLAHSIVQNEQKICKIGYGNFGHCRLATQVLQGCSPSS